MSRDVTSGAYDLVSKATQTSFANSRGAVDAVSEVVSDALGFVRQSNRDNQAQIAGIFDAQNQSKKTEAAGLSETALKIGLPAIAIIGLAIILKGK